MWVNPLHKRATSGLTPPTRASNTSAASLLAVLNPGNKSYIELEDMVGNRQKSLLARTPPSLRPVIRSIFQRFIFTKRSFFMSPKDFKEMYEQECSHTTRTAAPHQPKVPPKRPSIRPRPSEPASHLAQIAEDCHHLSSHSSFVTRECTPDHSPAPRRDHSSSRLSNVSFNEKTDRSGSQSPLDRSYTELYERKKIIKKQMETQDLVTACLLDSELQKVRSRSPSQGVAKPQSNRSSRKVPSPSFQRVYPNASELIAVRQRHLSRSQLA